MTRLRAAFATFLTLMMLAAGCGPRVDNSRVNLPVPVESTTLGAGDVFQLQIFGEKELPPEYQIASDGTVDLPYIDRLKVVGLEPQELAAAIRAELIRRKILNSPNVIITVKEYNSKRVSVLGQVAKPGSFPFRTGMSLVDAVSLAGGLTAIANRNNLYITRRLKGGNKTVVVSFEAITEGRAVDIPLQAGDQIFVNERVF